jgi:hypothetical protein
LLSRQRNAPISAKIKGSGCALGGHTLRKKVKIGFLAPSAFMEGIERWATRYHRGIPASLESRAVGQHTGLAAATAAIIREE